MWVPVTGIEGAYWADRLLCSENANPPPDLSTQSPEISGLLEMADFKSFYRTSMAHCNCEKS